MNKTPNFDLKVKSILDATKPGERVCALTGEKWLMDEEEIGWYRKFNVPPSAMHPQTRWKLAIGHYVGYQWWWNKHPETGKPILSSTHPATGIKVLPDEEWFQHDFISEARDFDSSKMFMKQFRELQLAVPSNATRNFEKPENSIAFVSSGDINSYFVLAARTRDTLYSLTSSECENSNLINWSMWIQNSHMVTDADKIYDSKYIIDCAEIRNSAFVFNCKDLEKCFFATNQWHKKYIWKDEQLSQGDWEKRWSELDFSCRSKLKEYEKEFHNYLNSEAIWPDNTNINSPGSTGEYIVNCLDLKHSFACSNGARDCYWVIHTYYNSERCAFISGMNSSADCFYSCAIDESKDIKFSVYTKACQSLEYCMNCYNCEFCFGCVGLNRKKFCIFNKQYSEDAYWQKVDELKCAMLDRGEYGEFFPLSYSQSYQPQGGCALYLLTEDSEYEKLGALIFDPESHGAVGEDLAQAQNPMSSSQIPDCALDGLDNLVGKPILDEKINRRFAFIKPEIEFYKKNKIAPPDEHFITRVQKLIWLNNGAVFYETDCKKCGAAITVAKNKTFPNRKIYCQECFYKFLESR
ncbi:TPA: hypothetical protein DCZ32_04915 [Candidatus Uhrbacteria bacterium]|nr:hypothetical protein [Candidatus Uhrbacteria bacterium]